MGNKVIGSERRESRRSVGRGEKGNKGKYGVVN